MRESAIVRKIMKAVKDKYPTAYVRKLSDRFTRGLTDIIAVVHGIPFFFETKTKAGKARGIQIEEIAEIRRAGGNAWIITTPEIAIQQIACHFELHLDQKRCNAPELNSL